MIRLFSVLTGIFILAFAPVAVYAEEPAAPAEAVAEAETESDAQVEEQVSAPEEKPAPEAPAVEEVKADEPAVADTKDVAQSDEAQSAAASDPEPTQEEAKELPPLKKPSKKLQVLNGELSAITKGLDDNQRRHFLMIYNSHNLISTVTHVKSQVSEAINACSEANPDMKDPLNKRFGEWAGAVDAKMVEAEANRDNMIMAQDYAEEPKIRSVLKQADVLRQETQRYMEGIPVTSKEACEYLLNKMDETQDNMVKLLEMTLITLPQQMQNQPE